VAKDLGGEDIVGLVLGFETVAQKEPHALAPARVSRSLSRIFWHRSAPFRFRFIVEEGSSHAVLTQTQGCQPVIINPKIFLELKSTYGKSAAKSQPGRNTELYQQAKRMFWKGRSRRPLSSSVTTMKNALNRPRR
jgi:hypothetical protein